MSENKSIAVYPGTFDPVTNGHLDIIDRALRIFPKLIVAVAQSAKKAPLFSLDERIAMLQKAVLCHTSMVSVEPLPGLLTDFLRSRGAKTIIRGLRAVSDFEYEFQMAMMNRKLHDSMDTMFLMTSEEYFFLTSTLIKEIARYGGDVAPFVPQSVLPYLQKKGVTWEKKPVSSPVRPGRVTRSKSIKRAL